MHDAQIRVLIVDDSATIREILSRILTELKNVEVVGQAQDAAGGLELTRQLHPDLVTLDLRMPGGSGLAVIEQLKQLEPPPIVMVLTNYPYPAYRTRCLAAGADYFLDKSTEFDRIPELPGQLPPGGNERGSASGDQQGAARAGDGASGMRRPTGMPGTGT